MNSYDPLTTKRFTKVENNALKIHINREIQDLTKQNLIKKKNNFHFCFVLFVLYIATQAVVKLLDVKQNTGETLHYSRFGVRRK